MAVTSRSNRVEAGPARHPSGHVPGKKGAAYRYGPLTMEQVAGFIDVLAGAYPLFLGDRERSLKGFQEVLAAGYPELVAAFDRDGRIAGTYAFYPFAATLLQRGFPASGLGMVATALDRRKQGVALGLVRDFVRRSRLRGHVLSFLYPFRHDFYAAMGWGAVGEAKQYSFTPSALPLYHERRDVRLVRETDWTLLDRIHRSAIGKRGGLGLSRHPARWIGQLRQNPLVVLAGPVEKPEGYLLARFTKREGDTDNARHDLEVIEMEWTTPAAMRGLLGFLSSQRDQVCEVILDWPRDGNLDAILREPVRRDSPHLRGHQGEGARLAHGVMLRLENPREAFRLRPYAGSDAVDLEVATTDPLHDDRVIRFRAALRGTEGEEVRADLARAGRRTAEERPAQAVKAALTTDLATLSRLWAGALRFDEALDFGLCTVEPAPAAEALDRLFHAPLPWVVERF